MGSIKDTMRTIYYKLRNSKYRKFAKNICEIEKEGILFVTHRLNFGGAEMLLYYMLKHYRKRNIPVVIISREYGPMLERFREYGFIKIIRNADEAISFATRLNEEYGYHRVLINTAVNGDLAEGLKNAGYFVLSAVHELDNTIRQLEIEKQAKSMAIYSDVIVFPSDFVKQRFENNWKLESRSVSKHQGLFLTEGKKCDVRASKEVILAKHPNIKKDDLIVLNVATGNLRKGIDFFIELAILASNQNKNIKFIWIGDKTAPHVAKAKKKNHIRQIPNLICPGYIADADLLQDYYCAADVFCLTSREEPFGSVVLEALNAYTPVVAFEDCGGYLDIVKNNETGLLAEKYNVVDMYNKILALQEEEKRNTLATNGHTVAQENSFDEYCQFYLDIFEGKNITC